MKRKFIILISLFVSLLIVTACDLQNVNQSIKKAQQAVNKRCRRFHGHSAGTALHGHLYGVSTVGQSQTRCGHLGRSGQRVCRKGIGVAGINNRVTVYFPEDDEEETYKLVTSIRGNSIHNYISTESPIGKAIFGHKAGETVKVKVSDDYSYELVIRKIEDTTDDEEDKIRAF